MLPTIDQLEQATGRELDSMVWSIGFLFPCVTNRQDCRAGQRCKDCQSFPIPSYSEGEKLKDILEYDYGSKYKYAGEWAIEGSRSGDCDWKWSASLTFDCWDNAVIAYGPIMTIAVCRAFVLNNLAWMLQSEYEEQQSNVDLWGNQ